MKHALWLAAPLLIGAAPGQEPDGSKPYALATLNVQQGGTRDAGGVYRGGAFKPVKQFTPPAEHGPRDALIAFEGPGWETNKVAYRLYLDERAVPDIYGKKLPRPVLPRIGQGKDDYHEMADWGQDILQVDQSLGTGGIGVWRGTVQQLGPSRISAAIANLPGRSTVTVTSLGFAGLHGPADMVATYSINAGSRVTRVEARVSGHVPTMMAGIVHHPGTSMVRGEAGGWRYAGTWGAQSLAKDELGMVIFYPDKEAAEFGEELGDKVNVSIGFCDDSHFRYAFAAAWVEEPGAPKTITQFDAWAKATAAQLGRTSKPIPGLKQCTVK